MWADKTGAASYPEVILLPPFNPLCTGVPINVQGVAPIGPLLREGCVDVPRARLYLLDGLLLGRVRNLEVRVSDGALRRLSRGISEDL
jgi:metallophosphoesterase superfamily enzyme